MHRRLVLVVVFCLATVAVFGVAAAPAAAQGSCDCHTAVPPTNDAPAAHSAYVASVTDCLTCHPGKATVPHTGHYGQVRLTLTKKDSDLSGWLGWLMYPGPDGRTVYLQQRLWAESAFTDLGQATTTSHEGTPGWYRFTVASPTPWAAYRAVAPGRVVAVYKSRWTVLPNKRVWKPTPSLNLKVGGVTLGQQVTATGTALPTLLAGEKVTVRLQKKIAGKWVSRAPRECTISATGTYGCAFTPKRAGLFRARAVVVATADHSGVRTAWVGFRVAR